MAGWEMSRHPEWDMMYETGLTVREIADRCQRRCNTVQRHLQVRELHEPGLRASHDAALKAREPNYPTTGWRRRLKEAQEFIALHGRLPNTGGDQTEQSLHNWIKGQRLAFNRGDMSKAKLVLLESLPGWNTATRERELDQQWHTRFSQFKDYIAATGQLPRHKNYETGHEHTLGVWLHIQHQKRIENKLRPWRLEALESALPDWRSRT